MEAPTTVSVLDVIRQPVDIPVRAWGGTGGRLQVFLPRQFSSSSLDDIADIPVPHHGFYGGFQGFHPGQGTAASSEQIVDSPVPRGGPHLQGPGFASLPQEVAGEAFQRVFSTFPWRKKVRRLVRTRGPNWVRTLCSVHDTRIPEQVIEVPKISSSRHSRRRRVRFAEQMAEQLVEVPTIISYSSLHGFVEQNVDIPVPHGRGRAGGGRLLGFTQDRVLQRLVEQSIFQQRLLSNSLTFQFRVVAEFFILHRRLLVCQVRKIYGGFSHLSPREKKVRRWVRTRGRNWVRTLLHPRRRLSWRISSRTQLVCGCGFQVVG